MPDLAFPVAVLYPRGPNLLCYPCLTEGSGALGKGGHQQNDGVAKNESEVSSGGEELVRLEHCAFSRVQDGKSASGIGHFVHEKMKGIW